MPNIAPYDKRWCDHYKHAMIEVIVNDRLGKKIRVKCNEDDTVGDLKILIAAQIGAFIVASYGLYSCLKR